ncbi:hypothetical protein M5D96_004320 [Drosophila gunungcola]|uniref:Uncharacterized protein n=2 Tax=Drosophila gunungcola TaxID=103775 RepID=A0A9Q0BSX8_9MUSC|nr:hypothetical protein M5D96_004320 [Drosophila gunungcola]
MSNRSTDDGLRRPVGEMYGWNGNNSGGQLGLGRNAPPPPQNLDWGSSGPRRNPSPVGMYDRNLSTNMMGYGNFENQRNRGRESNEFIPNSYAEGIHGGREPERFVPNDNFPQPMGFRNIQDAIFRNEPLLGNQHSMNMNRDGGRENQQFRGRESNEFIQNSHPDKNPGVREPEHFMPNDTFQQGNQPMSFRNIQEPIFRNEPLMGNQHSRFDNHREFTNENFGNGGQLLEYRRTEPIRRTPELLSKVFTIAGFKMPYVSDVEGKLPQKESKSYAVRFFKRSPDYVIRLKKSKDVPIIQHIYNDMTHDMNFMDEESGGKDNATGFLSSRLRDNIGKEWTKVYRGRDYRSWDRWWQDFRNIDVDINEQLDKFDCFNVKYNFMAPAGILNATELIKRATIALTRNGNSYLGNMKMVFNLMDHTLLGNLDIQAVTQLQDIIRSVPNHLWIYKLRCMIYTWYSLSRVMKSKDTVDRNYQAILKEWNSPVIHWLAKQAFWELRNISKLEYPEYRDVYGKNSKEVKK